MMKRWIARLFLTAALLWSWSATAQVRFVVYYNDLAALVAAPVSPTADIQRVAVVKYVGATGDIDTGGAFYYDPASVLATNATTVFKPTNAAGRWIRGNSPGSVGSGTNGTPAWANVLFYGALGNGIADDTAAFVAAYDAIKAKGGTIYVPPTTTSYLVNLVVTNDDIAIVGENGNVATGTNGVLRPWDTTKPVIQVGNDTGYAKRFSMYRIGIIAERAGVNCPGAIHLLGGAEKAQINQCGFLGGADTIKFMGGTTYPSELNRFIQCEAWEGTNATINAIYPQAGSYTTGNSYNDGHVNGHNTSGFAVRIDNGRPIAFDSTYFDMEDNRGFYLTNFPAVKIQNGFTEVATGLGLFTIDYRPLTNSAGDFSLTRFVEAAGDDLQGTVVFWDAVSTNSVAIPSPGWHNVFRYTSMFDPFVETRINLTTPNAPGSSIYQIQLAGTNDIVPLQMFRTDLHDAIFQYYGTNTFVKQNGPTNQNRIYAIDFENLGTNKAGVELFRNTITTNEVYLDVNSGSGILSRNVHLSGSTNSWVSGLFGNFGVGTQIPATKLQVTGGTISITSPTDADGTVLRIDSGSGSFGLLNDASIIDLAFSKLLAGQNLNALTNGNQYLSASVKELQDYSQSTTYSWDLDGKRSQVLFLTNNTTVSFANVPTATNAAEFFSLTISNTGAFTLAFTEPANGAWLGGEPVISAGAEIYVNAFWTGYRLALWSSIDGMTLAHFNTNQFSTNNATWPIAIKTDASVTNLTFPATQTASSGANTLDDYEEGTWTPSDISGAALAFTGVTGNCIYHKIGSLVTATFAVIYPVTIDGSAAAIAGLPFNAATTVNAQGGYITYTDAGVTILLNISAGNTYFTLKSTAGAGILNSALSGKEVRGTLIYRATQ